MRTIKDVLSKEHANAWEILLKELGSVPDDSQKRKLQEDEEQDVDPDHEDDATDEEIEEEGGG